jgi:hypothetical protein
MCEPIRSGRTALEGGAPMRRLRHARKPRPVMNSGPRLTGNLFRALRADYNVAGRRSIAGSLACDAPGRSTVAAGRVRLG